MSTNGCEHVMHTWAGPCPWCRAETYRAEREAERDAKEALARRNEELAAKLRESVSDDLSLYEQYLAEHRGAKLLRDPHGRGFCTYSFTPEGDVWIEDIFVARQHRKAGVAVWLADHVSDIARAAGARYLFGTVDLSLPGAQRSLDVQLAYGFTAMGDKGGVTFLRKSLEEPCHCGRSHPDVLAVTTMEQLGTGPVTIKTTQPAAVRCACGEVPAGPHLVPDSATDDSETP